LNFEKPLFTQSIATCGCQVMPQGTEDLVYICAFRDCAVACNRLHLARRPTRSAYHACVGLHRYHCDRTVQRQQVKRLAIVISRPAPQSDQPISIIASNTALCAVIKFADRWSAVRLLQCGIVHQQAAANQVTQATFASACVVAAQPLHHTVICYEASSFSISASPACARLDRTQWRLLRSFGACWAAWHASQEAQSVQAGRQVL
jgi:hypothetical protein